MKSERDVFSKLKRRLSHAPTGPGVYRWLDADGNVLYVGKAKNLKHRLSSYVQNGKNGRSPWTNMMISQIADFDLTVTNTDLEAFMLETNLIKELKPKYNVMMKDDKNFVYVRITVHDPFPRIDVVRRMEDDGALYFGPKTSADQVRSSLSFLRGLFPFRTCRMGIEPKRANGIKVTEGTEMGGLADDLNRREKEKIVIDVVCHDRDRPTPCIDYHIKQCTAPCIGAVTPEQYRKESIDGVIAFFEGKYADIERRLAIAMQEAASSRKFERAAELRDQLGKIRDLQEKQIVSDTSGANTDVVGVAVLSGRAHVVLLQERSGKLVSEESFSLTGHSDSVCDVLGQFLPQFYTDVADLPDTILIGEDIEERMEMEAWLTQFKGKRVRLAVPERGKKSQLLLLAEKNADAKARLSEAKWETEGRKLEEALAELAQLLNLSSPPERIEGYDISHQGGEETVGSMVVFEEGKPRRDHYRSFNLRSLSPGHIDDYRSLRETLKRRLKYLVENLKREEEEWKKQGIMFRKARKDEQDRIVDILKGHLREHEERTMDYREFLVALHEGEIVGLGSIHAHAKSGMLELKSLWLEEPYRETPLARFIARKLLKRITKGKVYAVISPQQEAEYGDLGFRHVLTAPAAFQTTMNRSEGNVLVVFDAKHNKVDESFIARPDLLLIDGGKGQLSTAIQVLNEYDLAVPAAGLAKREEEIFLPGRPDPIPVQRDSAARFLLQRLRDEAHRFANDRRVRRAKRTSVRSEFDAIEGIGDITKLELLKKFGSVEAVRTASDEELAEILNESQLKTVREKLS